MTQGILLAAFGATSPEAKCALSSLERRVRLRAPEARIVWAYTSAVLRSRLAALGEPFPSPSEGLMALRDAGATRIAVQPLHVVPGAEFHELSRAARAFAVSGGIPVSTNVVASAGRQP